MKVNIYTPNIIPAGKNGLSSRANFIQRRLYDKMFKTLKDLYDTDNFIDIKNDYLDFYKFDKKGNIVNISESSLKNIDQDIYVVNFVADAFEELKLLCKNNNKIQNEKFKKLKPKKGWSNLHTKYHNHMNLIYNEYSNYNKKTFKDKKINNFEDFLISYVRFLDNIAYKTPFLKSSYILSTQYSMIDTGFVVEIEQISNGNDAKKFNDFFLNSDYQEFIKLCKKTNFLLDKNCPWRLIYDCHSEKSENYMKKYQINSDNLFNEYFYRTEEFDLENLKNYMIIFYNTFVEKNPTAHNVESKTINEKQILVTNFIDRNKAILEEINNRYSDVFWFNIYAYISFIENKLDLNHQQYVTQIRILEENFRINGFKSALREMKDFISKCPKIQTKGEYSFVLPQKV